MAILAAAPVSFAVLLVYRRSAVRFAALGVARFLRGTLGRLSRRVEAGLAPDRIDASVTRYFETLDAAAADRRSLLVAAALALVGWTLFAVPLYTSAIAVGAPLSFGLVLFVVPAGGLATVVPLPGGVGGVEFAVAGMLVALTPIEPAVAGAMVVLYRVCVYWFVVLIGAASLGYTSAGLGSLTTGVPGGRRRPSASIPASGDRPGAAVSSGYGATVPVRSPTPTPSAPTSAPAQRSASERSGAIDPAALGRPATSTRTRAVPAAA